MEGQYLMAEENPKLDLYDPVEVELDHLRQLGVGDIKLDFNDPHIARFLAQQLIVRLHELRKTRHDIEDLRNANENIRNQVEDLRVLNGVLSERDRFSWLEFPAGVLCGIAGNLLTSDAGNFFAWGLLVLGIAFFVIIRLSQFIRKKEGN
jgi:hypothetical protein